jgi:RNA polymerase sigma-70 factor (ECF subfamily)
MLSRAGHFLPSRSPSAAGSETSDRERVERIRAGDESAFEALFTGYYTALCEFAQSYLHAPEASEELVQSIFLRIWEHRSEWQPEGIRAYLFAACRNGARDYQQHQRIVKRFEDRSSVEDLPAGHGNPPARPDEEVQAVELEAAFRKAVQELPERRRLVVVLRWEHHLSHAEIASVLGISVKTVETQFGRAIATLRKGLARFRDLSP